MRKYKSGILAVQLFSILLLIMSSYLESGITQVAYCFTVFTSPLLILAFGEIAFFRDSNYLAAATIVVFEACISVLFIGAMIAGMRMYADAIHLFGRLLLIYCVAAIISVFERVVTRARV